LKLARTYLTSLDFCLWGWMKSEVYIEKVNTRDELVARIMNSAVHLKQVRQDYLMAATRTVVKRVEKCIKSMVGFLTLTLNCSNLLRSFT
jgi:hypothetical protein